MSDNRIYECKDGRVRIYLKDIKKVMSYPKYLMEQILGRQLTEYEQVHHKDENPLNNDLSNLEVKTIGEHQRYHSTKYYDTTQICPWCGKEFKWTAKQQRNFYSNMKRENRTYAFDAPFCSRSCAGSFGRYIQLSY